MDGIFYKFYFKFIKITLKTFIMIKRVRQTILKRKPIHTLRMLNSTAIFNKKKKKNWAPNQHIRMISEESCDTEDWRNDAEKSLKVQWKVTFPT